MGKVSDGQDKGNEIKDTVGDKHIEETKTENKGVDIKANKEQSEDIEPVSI